MTTANTFFTMAIFAAAAACAQPEAGARRITFNGDSLTLKQERTLEALELRYAAHLPDGAYWYDNRTGAMGFWNGPAFGIVPAGLGLGGPMPANCSGGGTGVFVNGRELHPLDVAALMQIGPVYRGRYWMNAYGDFGLEHGPMLGNLVAMINQRRGGGGGGQHRVYSPGELSGVIVNPAGACTSSGCFYTK
jgi:hypothetical protein